MTSDRLHRRDDGPAAAAPPRRPVVSRAAFGAPGSLTALQRTAGNHAVASLAAPPSRSPGARGPLTVQRFESGHHERTERAALTAPGRGPGGAFTEAEAGAAYFGNWSRDLSQVFSNNAVVAALGQEFLFEVLNMLAMQKFGKELRAEDFGVYSPREHIDNPAGQMTGELMQNTNPNGPLMQTGADQFRAPAEDISSPAAISSLFTVNAAGLPAYLGRSRQYVQEELSQAADLGRTEDGLMHFGNGLHTVEDMFAHSNWLEIAFSRLIEGNRLSVTGEAAACVAERRAQGRTAIETLSGRTTSGRPIMTTGTFVLDDTLISVSEALSGMMKDFHPFGAGKSSARSQATMRLILGRYETLAQDDRAGQVVRSFLTHLGPTLKDKLAEAAGRAVAGEAVAESAPWYARAAGAVRSGAGSLVSGALRAGGRVMELGWVQDLCANAAGAIGRLPLQQAYGFTIKASNSIDQFFESLDHRLAAVPGYSAVKAVVAAAADGLREALRVPIEAAVSFVGEAVQKAFTEARTSGTNIAAQIRTAKEAQARNPLLRQHLDGRPAQEQIAMLSNPEFVRQLRLDPADPELRAARELLERLVAMESLPDHVKFGPSHSQIAKDHADSPFFGAATTMAAHLDTRLRDRMIDVWRAERRNTQDDPALRKQYSDQVPPDVQARRAAPGTPLGQMTPDQRAAEEEAAKAAPQYAEIRRAEEGRRMLTRGGIPESEETVAGAAAHVAQRALTVLADEALAFPRRMRGLAEQVAGFAPARAAEIRRLAEALGEGVDGITDRLADLQASGSPQQAEALARLLEQLSARKEALVAGAQGLLRRTAREVEEADQPLDALAATLRATADDVGPATAALARAMRALAHGIEEQLVSDLAGREQRDAMAAIDAAGGVATQEWDPELARSHARLSTPEGSASPARQALFSYVDEVFGHPWDSSWWEQPLLSWAGQNQARLEGYIHDVNTGNMHHSHR